MLLGWGAPFTAVQLLFVNVVADGLPGFALGKEPAEKELWMRHQSLKRRDFCTRLMAKDWD